MRGLSNFYDSVTTKLTGVIESKKVAACGNIDSMDKKFDTLFAGVHLQMKGM